MWNLLGNTDLFENLVGDDGEYDAHVHLAQMVTLLGEPPPLLLKREKLCRERKLDGVIVNPKGKECTTMNEYWGGAFFDEEGTLHCQNARLKVFSTTLTNTLVSL